jgi:serine protease AprX
MVFLKFTSLSARLGLAVGAGLVLVAGSLPGAAAALPTRDRPGHIDENVLRKAFGAGSPGTIRVIITRERSGNSDNDVRGRGGKVVKKLEIGNATVAEVSPRELLALASQPGVVRIAYDAPVKIQADPLTNCCDDLASAYPYAVDAVSQWNSNGLVRGTGIGVAVIDSGIRDSHPDFLGANPLDVTSKRVSLVRNGMSNGNDSGADDNGHGTFVAGIIAGRGHGLPGTGTGGEYIGVAPNANIISIKVSDANGMAHVSDVISAIEWIAHNREQYNIRIINLSLVSNEVGSYSTDMLDAAVELAWLQGLVVIVSAGNNGPNAAIASPANDPFIITVGATDDMGTRSTDDDRLARFSSYGQTVDGFAKPELVAPGRNIVSTLSSRTDTLAVEHPRNIVTDGYFRMSGTSVAAPVVSGMVAQLLQARPDLTPGQVKYLLTHTALPVDGPGTGAGYPRLGAALQYGANVPSSNLGLVPNQYLAAAYAAQAGLTTWDTVSWNTVSWNTVSWNTVSWNTVSWNMVSWNSVAWNTVSWGTAD